MAVAFAWPSTARRGTTYAGTILPSALLWGLGIGLAVTPLTAAVLAAVADADLGEAAAINDASRLDGLLVIAVVPALIGAGAGRGLGAALSHGCQPAMIALGGLLAAAALVTGLFVSDDRAGAPRSHRRSRPTAAPRRRAAIGFPCRPIGAAY